jgi:hypothetical protein
VPIPHGYGSMARRLSKSEMVHHFGYVNCVSVYTRNACSAVYTDEVNYRLQQESGKNILIEDNHTCNEPYASGPRQKQGWRYISSTDYSSTTTASCSIQCCIILWFFEIQDFILGVVFWIDEQGRIQRMI